MAATETRRPRPHFSGEGSMERRKVLSRPYGFTCVTARQLAHHPFQMASSIGFRMFSFLPSCYSSYGAWTLTPMGLSPTVHASLRWTHTSLLIRMTKVSLSRGTTRVSVRCVRDVVADAIQTIVFLFISHSFGRGYEYFTCQTISLYCVYYGHARELLLSSIR
jgi:hypothetical protein